MGDGWIKLHRSIFDSTLNSLPSNQKWIAMVILLSANHKERGWFWKGQEYRCQPGQFVTSLDSLAERSKESVKVVRTALKNLERIGFLKNESTNHGRLITILNWEFYQADDRFEDENSQKWASKKSPQNVENSTFVSPENLQMGKQGANNGQTEGKQGANNGQTEGKQGATNKNVRKKECNNERMKETTTTTELLADAKDSSSCREEPVVVVVDDEIKLLKHFEKCGFPVNGYTKDDISALLAEYGYTWCKNAMTVAREQGRLTMRYLKGILSNWKAGGGMDLERKPKKNDNPYVYDYENDIDTWTVETRR